jgi:hypothetical protein
MGLGETRSVTNFQRRLSKETCYPSIVSFAAEFEVEVGAPQFKGKVAVFLASGSLACQANHSSNLPV